VEDKRMKYEMKESTNARMARLCLPAINSVNNNLVFTCELPEEFEDKKLPTLDFYLWLDKMGLLHHSFFQKSMKTPLVIMEQSAMSDNQRHSILANELIRRLSNTDHEDIDLEETTKIIDVFTQQLKSSGYNRKTAREIVVSGTLGWKRKIKRREQEGTDFYRSARSTLAGRCRKKLLEKVTWYKTKRKREGEEDENKESQYSPSKRTRRDAHGQREQCQPMDKTMAKTNVMHKENVKAVMFVPYTVGSMLAKRMREAENTLQEMTGFRLKIVERSGTKLENVLAKADPWQGQDCGRDCLLCLTKQRTGKQTTQDCTRRSIVYESWCMTCLERDTKLAEEQAGGDMTKLKRMKEKIKLYKYVGESARSLFERSWEHVSERALQLYRFG
jgi:hypothetical protein